MQSCLYAFLRMKHKTMLRLHLDKLVFLLVGMDRGETMHRRGNMREPRGAESVVKHLDVPETRAIELVEAEKEDDHDDHAD